MSQQSDSQEAIVEMLRTDMPPAAGEDALRRVKASAILREPEVARSFVRRHPWRTVGGITAAAAAVALLFALVPRADTSVFAADKAADALLMQTHGRVLHVVAAYAQTRTNGREGYDPSYYINQQWSSWIDPSNQMRREEVNLPDGSLDVLVVQSHGRQMMFLNNIRYGSDRQHLIETPAGGMISSAIGGWVEDLRAEITNGTARVTGTKVIDGEEYWVVEARLPPDDDTVTSNVVTATMRKSDYRIKTWTSVVEWKNSDGDGNLTSRIVFEVYEEIERDTLPDDFFNFDDVIAAAEPGTPIEKQ